MSFFPTDVDLSLLTDAELEALHVEATTQVESCPGEIQVIADELTALEDELVILEEGCSNIYVPQPPTVDGEDNVDDGGDGPAVVEHIAVEISLSVWPGATGNGDDGIGIVQNWDAPIQTRINLNTLLTVSGEKVSAEAQLLEIDYVGSLPEGAEGSLLESAEGVIIADLFDPDAERFADKTFFVEAYAPNPAEIFRTEVFAEPADQIFGVQTGPNPPTQIFEVSAIETYRVAAAEPAFVVTAGPKPPFQIFNVEAQATPADQIFDVTRGAGPAGLTFEVLTGKTLIVSTSWGVPNKIFAVSRGPRPAPTPNQTYGVSVGGLDAPPIPSPDSIFAVTVGVKPPNRVIQIVVASNFEVNVANAPFIVTTGAVSADQVFEVTAGAIPFNQSFTVTTSAEPPDQVFDTQVIDTFGVAVYDAPNQYVFQQREAGSGLYEYIVSGNGLSFAVNPAIQAKVGQQLHLQMLTPALNTWIKNEQGAGPGEADPYFGDVDNNGTNSGFLSFRPWTVGTYYYQAEFQNSAFGEIVVTGVSAAQPDGIFEINVGIDPDGYDQLFVVEAGPEEAGQIFDITVEGGAPPANQTFSVEAGPERWGQVFTIKAAEAPVTYGVISNGSQSYMFTGGGFTNESNPELDVTVGQRVVLSVQAAGHPLYIKSVRETGTGNDYEPWADALINNGQQLGTLAVVFNTPGTYFYVCGSHGSMSGVINVTGDADSPFLYSVGSDSSGYYLTGNGLFSKKNPSLTFMVGQTVDFAITAPAHPFWIKTTDTIGGYTGDTLWASQLINNGATNDVLRVTFTEPRLYYYRSQYGGQHRGVITVEADVFVPDYSEAEYQYSLGSQTGNYLFTGEGISGVADPALEGKVGDQFVFNLDDIAGHPFWIKDFPSLGVGNEVESWADQLTGNGQQSGQTVVVFNTAGTYFYICEYHGAMVGTITITDP